MEKIIQNNEQVPDVSKHVGNGVVVKTRHKFPLAKAIAQHKAKIQFKKFKKALKEVEQIEAGIIKPKSLQQLLNDL